MFEGSRVAHGSVNHALRHDNRSRSLFGSSKPSSSRPWKLFDDPKTGTPLNYLRELFCPHHFRHSFSKALYRSISYSSVDSHKGHNRLAMAQLSVFGFLGPTSGTANLTSIKPCKDLRRPSRSLGGNKSSSKRIDFGSVWSNRTAS